MKERISSRFFMRLLPLALLPAGFMVAGRRESAVTADRDCGDPQNSLKTLGEPEAEALIPVTEPGPEDPPAQDTTVNLRKLIVETRRQIAEQLDSSFEGWAEPVNLPTPAPDETAREGSIYCVVLNEESPAPPEEPTGSTEDPQPFEPLDLKWDPTEEGLLSLYRRDHRASHPPDQLALELTPWWKREAAHAVFGAILVGLAILALLVAYFVL